MVFIEKAPGSMLKRLADVADRFRAVCPNFSEKCKYLSKFQFYERIPTVTALLTLAKHFVKFGYCNSLDMSRMDRLVL